MDDYLNSEAVESLSLNEVLDILVSLNKAKRDLSAIYEMFARKVASRMDEENVMETTINGVEIQKKVSYGRKSWDNQRLIEDTYDRICQSAVDMDTGEVVLSSREAALKLLEYFNPSYWRVKELSKLGINADQYCEVGEDKVNIAIYLKGENK